MQPNGFLNLTKNELLKGILEGIYNVLNAVIPT